MPKKKDSVITNLGNTKKLVVQKSRPLLDIVRMDLPIESLKLLDTYLAKIDSSNPECRTVVFKKKEYEQMLGVSRIREENLISYLENLIKPVSITQKIDKEKIVTTFPLFSKASAKKNIDSGDSAWEITLTCHEDAMDYIFRIEEIGYLKYNIEDVIKITSKYSYILYLYLKDNIRMHKKTCTIRLDELKTKLGCFAPKYRQFKFFKAEILNSCKKEIEAKTPLRFTFETIKEGRSVVAVTFYMSEIKSLSAKSKTTEKIVDVEPVKLPESKPSDNDKEKDWVKFYGSEITAELAAQCEYTFSKKEMQLIERLLVKIDIAPDELADKPGTCRFGREAYLREKYLRLCAEEERKAREGDPIKSRFAYLRKMLENEAEEDSDE